MGARVQASVSPALGLPIGAICYLTMLMDMDTDYYAPTLQAPWEARKGLP